MKPWHWVAIAAGGAFLFRERISRAFATKARVPGGRISVLSGRIFPPLKEPIAPQMAEVGGNRIIVAATSLQSWQAIVQPPTDQFLPLGEPLAPGSPFILESIAGT